MLDVLKIILSMIIAGITLTVIIRKTEADCPT